ncbi:hypothetical protein AB0B89_35615, partial [Sphaerisporangium sp. NPDC049002]|uniref:hypothetical protein n=1 Tax=Sphaerisporangium sp. NPDC049002 TaxID=3155392 RepID=UPI0033FF1CBA
MTESGFFQNPGGRRRRTGSLAGLMAPPPGEEAPPSEPEMPSGQTPNGSAPDKPETQTPTVEVYKTDDRKPGKDAGPPQAGEPEGQADAPDAGEADAKGPAVEFSTVKVHRPKNPPEVPPPGNGAPRSSQNEQDEEKGADQDRRQAEESEDEQGAVAAEDAPGEDLEEEVSQQINVYILPEAVRRARALCDSRGLEHSDIAMDALDDAIEQEILGVLLEARQVRGRPKGSTFPARKRRRPKAQQGIRRSVWPIQFSQSQIDILDELKKQYGTRYTSELISVAVEAHLLDDEPAGAQQSRHQGP